MKITIKEKKPLARKEIVVGPEDDLGAAMLKMGCQHRVIQDVDGFITLRETLPQEEGYLPVPKPRFHFIEDSHTELKEWTWDGIFVSCAKANHITIILPPLAVAVQQARWTTIKEISGRDGSITIHAHGAETIDGQVIYRIPCANYTAISLCPLRQGWFLS